MSVVGSRARLVRGRDPAVSRVFRRGYVSGRAGSSRTSLAGVARWTGTWISGLAAAGVDRRAEGSWPGRRYGLPEDGEGAAATTGSRFAALFVDLLAGSLIAAFLRSFVDDPSFLVRTLLVDGGGLVLPVVVLQALTGQSLGMKLIGIRVAKAADPAAVPGLVSAALRTALLVLVLPAVLLDRDGRGLHDKAAGTIVLRGSASFAG